MVLAYFLVCGFVGNAGRYFIDHEGPDTDHLMLFNNESVWIVPGTITE